MHQMSLARLLVWMAVLGVALATADTARTGTVIEPEIMHLAGLDVAVWRPTDGAAPYPLALFSHGAGGCNAQSTYLMRALAEEGMVVAAP